MNHMMTASNILEFFYPEDTPLRRLLLRHSLQVQERARQILEMAVNASLEINRDLVLDGALLHDIGILRCHAPSILCTGNEHYLAHGTIGAMMLREFAKVHEAQTNVNLEACARICERHTGTGLSADEIIRQNLPLPHQDFIPETTEEKLICLADKFFSKSAPDKVITIENARKSLEKFGQDTIRRYDDMCRLFHLA